VIDSRVARHGANPWNLVPDGDRTEADGRVRVVEADIGDTDRPDVRDATVAADVVFNLAGQVSHVDSMDDPLFDLNVNTTSQFRYLELLRRENPSATVVFTSTRKTFGKRRYLPSTRTTRWRRSTSTASPSTPPSSCTSSTTTCTASPPARCD